ncbi:MAG: capsular polysaccharide biosynthesis protein, partial [Pseudomonadota bacterium]
RLTRAQLAAAALILAPTWYDPCRDRLCAVEDVVDHLEARVRAYREDRNGYVATGMRLWKRGPLQRFFGRERAVTFVREPEAAIRASAADLPILAWAGAVTPQLEAETARLKQPLLRVEDGFLRSRGLGAALVPPLSLVRDDLGIYYDPGRESRLERDILAASELSEAALRRVERLIALLTSGGVTKYNTGGTALPDLPAGRRILVPGQVEDDASIRLGCTGEVRTNLGLLEATRAANPEAVLLYKPHPDVEAGLRAGAVAPDALAGLADVRLDDVDAATALSCADEVWTLTSAMGFEALLRGLPVTCLGAPFYAGWGLTADHAPVPHRRTAARPDLRALAHAALIDYPRYHDPVRGLPCPPEVVLERLMAGAALPRQPLLRHLSKLQGAAASYTHLWR